MTEDKKQRVATAVGFLSGVLACTGAIRDSKVFWPPDVLWESLSHAHRLEFGGGIALALVTFVVSIVSRGSQPS